MTKKGKSSKTSRNVDLFMLTMQPLVGVWGFTTPISRTMSFVCRSIALTLRAPVLSDRSEACAFLWLASSFSELTPSENIPINSWRGTTISSSDNTYGRWKAWNNKKYTPFIKSTTMTIHMGCSLPTHPPFKMKVKWWIKISRSVESWLLFHMILSWKDNDRRHFFHHS